MRCLRRWPSFRVRVSDDGDHDGNDTLRERLGRHPRLIALVGLSAWLAMLWFMFGDVL